MSINLHWMRCTNRHTYSSPGTYTMYMEDPNRNYGVVNIPNSVNVPMYVQTILVINPFLGYNNSPTLLNPPVDVGCVDQIFIHNPGAYDVDGDSLSYRLVNLQNHRWNRYTRDLHSPQPAIPFRSMLLPVI